jgi:hypothetical protein
MSNTNEIKYKMLDGKIFKASSPTNLVNQMREDSMFGAGKDLNDFMVNVSVSSYEYNHSNIRTDTHENFIADLMAGGFIEIVE